MTKKRKYRPDIKSSTDPVFRSTCCLSSVANWTEIIEDAVPHSRVIAIIGQCHACMGIQPGLRVAENIDSAKLLKHLFGKNKILYWLLEPDEVKSLRIDPDKPHGELRVAVAPQQGPKASQSTPVEPEPPPEAELEENNGMQ